MEAVRQNVVVGELRKWTEVGVAWRLQDDGRGVGSGVLGPDEAAGAILHSDGVLSPVLALGADPRGDGSRLVAALVPVSALLEVEEREGRTTVAVAGRGSGRAVALYLLPVGTVLDGEENEGPYEALWAEDDRRDWALPIDLPLEGQNYHEWLPGHSPDDCRVATAPDALLKQYALNHLLPACLQLLARHGPLITSGNGDITEKERGVANVQLGMLAQELVHVGAPRADAVLALARHAERYGVTLESLDWLARPLYGPKWSCALVDLGVLVLLREREAGDLEEGEPLLCSRSCPFSEPEGIYTYEGFATEMRGVVVEKRRVQLRKQLKAERICRTDLQDPFGTIKNREGYLFTSAEDPDALREFDHVARKLLRNVDRSIAPAVARHIASYLWSLPVEVVQIFDDVAVRTPTGSWHFPGRLSTEGDQLARTEQLIEIARGVWCDLHPKVRTMWALAAANLLRFRLLDPRDGLAGLVPVVLLLGLKSSGKTTHARQLLYAFGGVEGSGHDLLGTGIRISALGEQLDSPNSVIFVDESKRASEAASMLVKTLATAAYKNFARGRQDGTMRNSYLAFLGVVATNGMQVDDDATLSRFYVLHFPGIIDERPIGEQYQVGKLPEGWLLKLIAHTINTRWASVDRLWHWPRACGDRPEDCLRVAEFGARLVDLALDVPQREVLYGTEEEVCAHMRIEPPLSEEAAGGGITTAEGASTVLGLNALWREQVVSSHDPRLKRQLGEALLADDLHPESEAALALRDVYIARSSGGEVVVRIGKDGCEGLKLPGGPQAVHEHCRQRGIESKHNSYVIPGTGGSRKRMVSIVVRAAAQKQAAATVRPLTPAERACMHAMIDLVQDVPDDVPADEVAAAAGVQEATATEALESLTRRGLLHSRCTGSWVLPI